MNNESEAIDQKERCVTMYRDVGAQVDQILNDVDSIKLKNEKGNAHLNSLKEKLSCIREQFSEEVQFLEEHSEWDTFTIAFFGETNAGKSTILESLRILFDEQKRQESIRQNMGDTLPLSEDFTKKTDLLLSELNELYQRYQVQTSSVADELSALVEQYNHDHSIKRKAIIWGGFLVIGLLLGLGVSALAFGGA